MNGARGFRTRISSRPRPPSMSVILTCVNAIILIGLEQCICQSVTERINAAVLQSVLRNYGTNGTLTYQELESFLEEGGVVSKTFINATDRDHTDIITGLEMKLQSTSSQDFKIDCFTLKDVFRLYNLRSTSTVNVTILQEMSPALLYMMKYSCVEHEDEIEQGHHVPPSPISVWGYGFLMVTVINLCSLVGVMVLPFMKMAAYKQILIFMVALAVGALAGSGLLFLIPEAFGLVGGHDEDISYIYKASTVLGGIYLFYLTEKIMRMVTNWKERRNHRRKHSGLNQERDEDELNGVNEVICSVKQTTPVNQDSMYKEASTLPSSAVSSSTQQELLEKSSEDSNCCKASNGACYKEVNETYDNTVSSSSEDTRKSIKPLAWMIIFGDGLHNFIDGLSIGTAFTQSTLAGVSVSVAVMCEELPHELGDFAILLNCGMSVKKALLYNFLSACMCYFGLVIGILLGENTTSHDWVFAIAGGMFLYISLADMMPEMNSASETKGNFNPKQTFLIQNLGLLSGFGIMFILAIFGRRINFE